MPRIPAVQEDDLPSEYKILNKKDGKLPDEIDTDYWNEASTVGLIGNNKELAKTHVYANTSVWVDSDLSLYEVELVIISVARKLKSEFEWHAHSQIGINRADIPVEVVKGVSRNDLSDLTDAHTALVEYVFEYVENGGEVEDETHDLLADHYDNEQLIGITMLAGYYILIDHMVSALQLGVGSEFVGWDLENLPENHPRYG